MPETLHTNDTRIDRREFAEDTELRSAWTTSAEICAEAKKVSPETNQSGELDGFLSEYQKELTNIEQAFGSDPSDKKTLALQEASQKYEQDVRTAVGTTEGSQAKLVQDGERAISQTNRTKEQQTADWKESMQKFAQELRKLSIERERARLETLWQLRISARAAGNTEAAGAQREAPEAFEPWPT